MRGASKCRHYFVLLNYLIIMDYIRRKKSSASACAVKKFLKGISGKGKMSLGESIAHNEIPYLEITFTLLILKEAGFAATMETLNAFHPVKCPVS